MNPSNVPDFAKERYPQARNTVIGRPPGYSEEEVGGLPALIDSSDVRFPAIRSYWQPSGEELKALADGAYIELEVIAHQMVPVALNIVAPEPADGAAKEGPDK